MTTRDAAGYELESAQTFPFSSASNLPADPEKLGQALRKQCGSQRIRSSGQVQNFSVFGIFLILGISVLFWVASLSAAPVWGWASKDKKQLWENDELLTLWKDAVKYRSGLSDTEADGV